jgi:hypothetical protein
MNSEAEVTERPDVGLDERWRGAAVVAAIAAVALLVLLLVGGGGTDFDYGAGVDHYIDNFDSIPVAATLYLVADLVLLIFLISLATAISRAGDLGRAVVVGMAAVTTAVSATLRALWVSPVLGTDPGADVATSEVAKLDPGVADYVLGLDPGWTGDVTAVLTGACLIALGVIMFSSHIVGHRTLAVLYVLVGANGLGSIITELWPWVLYPPLYLATAVLLLITLRRESPVAPPSELSEVGHDGDEEC